MIGKNHRLLIQVAGLVLALQFSVLFAGAQVLTNRTPDKAQITASPTPTPRPSKSPSIDSSLITPDPALFPPGVKRPPIRYVTVPAYYITLRGVKSLLVSDDQGRVDDLFPAGVALKNLENATYNPLGEDSYMIVLPVDETYSITFECRYVLDVLEILKGRGNTSPDEAIRYVDLDLGGKARIQITPQGVGPLRVDSNRDGTFDLLIKPTVKLRGQPAKDTKGPVITFDVIERTATTLVVSIKAMDKESGVKAIYYFFEGQRVFQYKSPIRINLDQVPLLWAFADDNAANSSVYKFRHNNK